MIRRSVLLFALALVATIGFASIAEEVAEGEADAFDRTVSDQVHALGTPTLDVVMTVFTVLGSGLALTPAVGGCAIWALRRREPRLAAILFAGVAVVEVANLLLKHVFARPRPHVFALVPLPDTWSFPSGHAMTSMTVYGAIAAIAIRLTGHRLAIILATALLVAGVGISRVYLGVHWPTDVLGGWLAGAIPLAVTIHLVHRREVDAQS